MTLPAKFLMVLALLAGTRAFAAAPSTGVSTATRVDPHATTGIVEWSGSVTCVTDANRPNYSRHETQTWTLTGEAPKMQGAAIALYPATWHYTGHGFLQKTNGTIAEWSVDTEKTVRIAIFVRASDQQLTFHQWDTIAIVPGAITGTQQSNANNQPATSFTYAAEQWNFEWIVDAAKKSNVSGTRQITAVIPPQLAYNPVDVGDTTASGKRIGEAAVTWQFTKVGAVTANPPAVAPQTPAIMAPPSTTKSKEPTTNVTIDSVTPRIVEQGEQHARFVVQATGTHWQSSITKANFGPGITVTKVLPDSPGYAQVDVVVNLAAALGPRTVSLTTPMGATTEVATLANAITVQAPQDPANFTATQTGEGQVDLKWDAVPNVGAFLVLGPGATDGTKVLKSGLTLTGIPNGKQEWRVTSWYDPDGSRTKAESWPKASVAVVPSQGYYRILFAGLRVYHQTFHDQISPNGSGDEVYAAAGVHYGTRNTDPDTSRYRSFVLSSDTVLKTRIHGNAPDPNEVTGSSFDLSSGSSQPLHVRAGTATAQGGLTNGDVFPPDATSTPAAAVDGSFPFLLWEGTLSKGKDAVVIIPSLWKSVGDMAVYNSWATKAAANFWNDGYHDDIRNRVQNADLSPFWGSYEFPSYTAGDLIHLLNPDFVGPDGSTPSRDRPIGIVPSDGTGYPADWHCYRGRFVVVTQEAIEKALYSDPQPGAVPPGIVALHFVDTAGSDFGGSYDLFMRVERGALAGAAPNVTGTPAPGGNGGGKVAPSPTNNRVPKISETGTSPLMPAITGVIPTSGQQWDDKLVVTFDAKNTHFVQGMTKVDLGAGVTPVAIAPYQAVDIASPTKAIVTVKIAGDAAPGPRNVTITTGSEVVKLANAFTVAARDVKQVFALSPDIGTAGAKNMSVTITRTAASWSSYFYLGTQLDFGPGIAVNSVEVQGGSKVSAMLTISSNAASGPRTVTVKRPTFSDETFAGAFAVTATPVAPGTPQQPAAITATPMAPIALSAISPSSAMQGAQNLILTLTGSFPEAAASRMLLDFGSGITVASPLHITSPNTATVQVNVAGTAATGTRNVGLAPSVTLSNAITVTPKPDQYGKSCDAATVFPDLYLVGPQTIHGTLHTADTADWFRFNFFYPTQALALTLQDDVSGPGGTDFEMVVVPDNCDGLAAAVTQGGVDPKKLVVPPPPSHVVYVGVKAASWNVARPHFTLTLAQVAPPGPITTVFPISFTAAHLVVPDTDIYSETVVIKGPTTKVPIGVDYWNGLYSINGGNFTGADGFVSAGDKVRLKCRLSLLDVKRTVNLHVGDQTATWEVTTLP